MTSTNRCLVFYLCNDKGMKASALPNGLLQFSLYKFNFFLILFYFLKIHARVHWISKPSPKSSLTSRMAWRMKIWTMMAAMRPPCSATKWWTHVFEGCARKNPVVVAKCPRQFTSNGQQGANRGTNFEPYSKNLSLTRNHSP